MPLSPAFSVTQSALLPGTITVVDDSTGSDGAITQKRVYVQTAEGEYLVPSGTSTDYTPWPVGDASISLAILSTDQSCSITIQWLNVSNTVLYSLNQVFCFPQYNKNFFYYLLQNQALTPSILQDTTYFSNLATYWTLITGAIQAIEIGADISNSQNCLNQATNMQQNQTMYF